MVDKKNVTRREALSKIATAAIGAGAVVVVGGAAYYLSTQQPTPPITTTTAAQAATTAATAAAVENIKACYIGSSPMDEPWTGVVHHALQQAVTELGIEYNWAEKVDYSDMPRVMREYAGRGFNLQFIDSAGCETTAREVALDFQNVNFLMMGGAGPVDPNVAVCDDWIHEPAYLCGMIAGKLTQSNVIGAVCGFSIPECNRLVNAYRDGAKEVNPDVKVKITFLSSWFDPPKAREASIAQMDQGADVMYAERFGVIDACKLRGIPAFGNLLDQYDLAPEVVLTGPIWDMWPTVKAVVTSAQEKRFLATDYAEWSMMGKGGAKLADWHDWETRLLPKIVSRMQETDVMGMVESRIKEIVGGTFKVPIEEQVPTSD